MNSLSVSAADRFLCSCGKAAGFLSPEFPGAGTPVAAQPLTEPLASPAYTCFWKIRNTIREGIRVSSTPAQIML